MPDANQPLEPIGSDAGEQLLLPTDPFVLTVTLDVGAGAVRFEWSRVGEGEVVARGRLVPTELSSFRYWVLDWVLDRGGQIQRHACNAWPASIRALLKRIGKEFSVAPDALRVGLLADRDLGTARAGCWLALALPTGADPWKWLAQQILHLARLLDSNRVPGTNSAGRGRNAIHVMACALLGVAPLPADMPAGDEPSRFLFDLCLTFDTIQGFAGFAWSDPRTRAEVATGRVHCTGMDELTWELAIEGRTESSLTSPQRRAIADGLGAWLRRLPTNRATFRGLWASQQPGRPEPFIEAGPRFGPDESPYPWIEENLVMMAEALRLKFAPLGRLVEKFELEALADLEHFGRRLFRKEQKRAEQAARLQENMARLAEARRQRERETDARWKAAQARPAAGASATRAAQSASQSDAPSAPVPVPPVPVHLEPLQFVFQETAFPVTNLGGYFLREHAALWWVSNQSDDLLCLPHCRIEHLEYQLRTALRVLGPMRGRALLSDEVGLGKTIEAGLVIKELLTRGMVKRFLVLTVPSLVDQWEEELSDKFGLGTVTTNQTAARGNIREFWQENPGIVASLHTLKQPAQLAVAREVHWDILVVDEAHYLRNRDSQAWQAVNALPRQFLLLLTATPVQNSLDELYNLVTLLRPGQLLTPGEFRARFLDPKRPRQPREPEELRRLLGQVMIRNTRGNAGVRLPSRRAETVLFDPEAGEREFWRQWEGELREHLARLNAAQASLWGRLLLQAAGSSPAAWREALEKFPDPGASAVWREQAPLEASWRRKCELIPPLTRVEGGAVVFTQFLGTQAALAGFLRGAGVETFAINGSTPPPQRQPITEAFRKRGGALLLTHSGTEGGNLQFCHRLANFDLPWNPMEIEQRIGRLHRLGQQHPVRIYNFVQAGTLQEHLLQVLQEKLNLFELVVGETGLVLGERFGSDEFAEEILRRWRDSEGRVAEALAGFGDELAAARDRYDEVKQLDATLFAQDYESI